MSLTLNRKTDYAIQLLRALKIIPSGQFLSLAKFAQQAYLPFLFLQRVAADLCVAGLIRAARGRGGGYQLAKPARAITIYDAVTALEGKATLVPCLAKKKFACPHAIVCQTKINFHTINARIQKYLRDVSVADL